MRIKLVLDGKEYLGKDEETTKTLEEVVEEYERVFMLVDVETFKLKLESDEVLVIGGDALKRAAIIVCPGPFDKK